MSVLDYFRNFLGLFRKPPDGGSERQTGVPGERPSEFRKPVWGMDDDDDDDDFRSQPRHFGFSIHSDPFEMHRFFEQQLDEMLRKFQSFGFGNMYGGSEYPKQLPESEDYGAKELRDQYLKKNLWEEYLKPGYDTNDSSHDKTDSDLDERISSGSLDKFFKTMLLTPKPEEKSTLAEHPDDCLVKPYNFFFKSDRSSSKPEDFVAKPDMFVQTFGQSVSKKTVCRPDGGIEYHYTVKDSQGNEERTITRQIGEQSYSVTTKTKASGEQEFIKKFINLDEEQLENFEKKWGSKL